MKIYTWNVNSVRARLELILQWVQQTQPDILLLQEIKCETAVFPTALFEDLGYNVAVYGQKTYNGVAILSKSPLEDVVCGLPTYPHDTQARYIEAVTAQVRVASLYVPNGMSVGSDKYTYKLEFLTCLREHLKNTLLYEEAFAIGGDYNIAPHDLDVHHPEEWKGHILCSAPERQAYQSILHLGYTDALRLIHPDASGLYTWWDYRSGAWPKDAGLRIDHFLLSPQMADVLLDAHVDKAPRGWDKASDHAPVWVEVRN